MTESDRAFITTVLQIVPVLLLALVVEARLFRFTREDAIVGVRAAREELKRSMPKAVYGLWRGHAAYRRGGISTIVLVVVAFGLAAVEFIGLLLLANDMELDRRLRSTFVVALGIGVFFVAVKPVFDKLIDQNVELVQLERDVQRGMEQLEAEKREAERQAAAVQRKWWQRRPRA